MHLSCGQTLLSVYRSLLGTCRYLLSVYRSILHVYVMQHGTGELGGEKCKGWSMDPRSLDPCTSSRCSREDSPCFCSSGGGGERGWYVASDIHTVF